MASSKPIGVSASIKLNPNALPYTNVSSNTKVQGKTASCHYYRISPRLVHSTSVCGSSSTNSDDLPRDLVLLSSAVQFSLMSYDMLKTFAMPGSLTHDFLPPLLVIGSDVPVEVTSQATLMNSSLKACVLPKGHSLDHLILCEGDLSEQSWGRNEINGSPFLTRPSSPPVRLYRIDARIFISFSSLFSAWKANIFRLPLNFNTSVPTPPSPALSPPPPPDSFHSYYTVYGNVRVSTYAQMCDWTHRSCRHMSLTEALAVAKGGYVKNFCF